ncbi:MAG: hypothetical protein Q8O55_08375, partial [Dehalococcoidales bacterium]|nr:hypothetical protein [Dehalococcoidales bacterium]
WQSRCWHKSFIILNMAIASGNPILWGTLWGTLWRKRPPLLAGGTLTISIRSPTAIRSWVPKRAKTGGL